ncbi:translation initiation factor IF-2-like [Motacilla alba alba]|uniref:translation initiation factor IF-2-like n=1 Tax=Motacilla alba alba TaxID=1094192 RepID=UPI0018D56562|nr:translation initiation factor IF-2-like [Motacilla alba alba]
MSWSSSIFPLRCRPAIPVNTEPVTAPAAQLPASGAAGAVATRPAGPAGLSPGPCRTLPPQGTAARGRQQRRARAGLHGAGPGRRCRGCRRGRGRAAAGWGGSPGSGLTHEPDGRLSQGLLWALQVAQGPAQVLGRSAPVLCQLQRAAAGEAWRGLSPRAGRSLRAAPASPARAALRRGQQPLAPGSGGGRAPAAARGAAGPPRSAAGPGLRGHPARARRSLEKSPRGLWVQQRAAAQRPAPHAEHRAQGSCPG